MKELRTAGKFKDKDPIVEFVSDIAAMANSEGGDIIFGVDDDTLGLTPIAIDDLDQTKLRLQQFILTIIEPKLTGYDFQPIEVEKGKYILILRVLPSLIGPHQVTSGPPRFFMRHPGGKHPMDIAQIRAAFLASGQAIERARAWRQNRFATIMRNEGQLPLRQGPVRVLHFIPLSFLDPSKLIDMEILEQQRYSLPSTPFISNSGRRYNADGFLTMLKTNAAGFRSYLQFYREGTIEAVSILPVNESAEKVFAGQEIEENMIEGLECYLKSMFRAGVTPPILVGVAYFNVMGYRIAGKNFSQYSGDPEFSIIQDVIQYRDELFSEWNDSRSVA
ncbi:MAG: ATP-binding protein, partial [Cyanobacteria bacterium]|nr:ATP-binding protein [Cyanobacteriota bacterium]